jgi:hypothetical protein
VCVCVRVAQSDLAKVDLATGLEVERLRGVGTKAHSIVRWGALLLLLDSDGAALTSLDPRTHAREVLWKVRERGRRCSGRHGIILRGGAWRREEQARKEGVGETCREQTSLSISRRVSRSDAVRSCFVS